MIVTSQHPGDLIFISWLPGDVSASADQLAHLAYRELRSYLEQHNALMLHERIFTELDLVPQIRSARCEVLRGLEERLSAPPTYVQGLPFNGSGIAGIQAIAVRADEVSTRVLSTDERVYGRIVEGVDARYLYLSDISSLLKNRSQLAPVEETSQTFELATQLLSAQGWSFSDVCRTWFYLYRILDWYDDFNSVRNAAFAKFGLHNASTHRPIPASTGIFGCNPDHSWCTLDVLAVQEIEGRHIQVKRLANPQQNEAPEYGSAFSRGLCVNTDRCKYIFVSGTASINGTGESIHIGDFERQTEYTFETVRALLASAGAHLTDICRATAFVKQRKDTQDYHRIVNRLKLDGMPSVNTIGDVCRRELLFELDATAVVPMQTNANDE